MKKKPLPLPFDVRLMNVTATVLFAACALALVAALGWWALRHPAFALGGIVVEGDVAHNSAATLRANVAPRLAGNFFTLDLREARAAFEAVPWVRQAVVRRQFPDKLRVQLQEHRAAAFWGTEAEPRLVNTYGEVFDANPGEADEDLPHLVGPQGTAPQVLALYRGLKPMLDRLELGIAELALTGRGGWTLHLDSGATVELGRGSTEEVLARSERFARTLTQVTAKYDRRPDALVTADLRHADGYAVKLRGVGTTPAQGN